MGIPHIGIMGMQKTLAMGKRNQAGLISGMGGMSQGVMHIAVQGIWKPVGLNQESNPKPCGP